MNINPLVVDLSHYQSVRDWSAVHASGIRGVINKATEGPGMIDKTFALRRSPATAAGLLYGAYHFLRPGDVQTQVSHFLGTAGPHEGLLLAVDHEDPKVPLSALKEFCVLVRAAVGRYPILYSGFLAKQQLGPAHDPLLAQVKLWLSHYSSNPKWPPTWSAPWLWQFTGDGIGPGPHTISGIDGDGLDIDSFAGTADQLSAEWAT